MLMELLLVLPLYLGIFVIYFRFKSIIKGMTEANDILSDLISEKSESGYRVILASVIFC